MGTYVQASHLRSLVELRKRLPPGTPASARIGALLDQLGVEAQAVAQIADYPDLMESGVAHQLRLDAAQSRLRDLAATMRGQLNGLINSFATEHDAARLKLAQLIPNAYAAELRTVFRGLGRTEQLEFLARIIKDRDGASAAALLLVSPTLSGLSAEQVESYRKAFLDQVSESADDVVDELRAVCETSLRVIDSVATARNPLRTPPLPAPVAATPPAPSITTGVRFVDPMIV
jgi:hypothetical protein